MESIVTSTFAGPNIYSQRPVVRFALHTLSRRRYNRRRFDQLFSALSEWNSQLPANADESCFKLDNGELDASHLFEHVCIELQNRAGAELRCVRDDYTHRFAAHEAIVPYEDPDICIQVGHFTAALLSRLSVPDHDPDKPVIQRPLRLDEFVASIARKMLPVQDRALINTARSLDIPVTRIAGRMIALGQGRFQQRLSATKTSLTNVVSNDIATNKDYSRRMLVDVGLPIPRYVRIRHARDAADAADRLGYPVVVKPNSGAMGGGVSVGMNNRREVRDAYRRAREYGRSVLVEEEIEGADYRMLVIDGELCAAAKRVPGHVVGDGIHTVEELVAAVNSDPRRGDGPANSWTRIQLDAQADRLLDARGYSHETKPSDGEVVYLRRNANTSDGGTAVDVTDDVHPDNRLIAERAAKAIGLDVAGVDLLTKDISTSMWTNGGSICEINSRPGIRKHLWPAEGKPRDVIKPILNMLFPHDRPRRVPIVAVIGSGNTGTTASILAHVLGGHGHYVGLSVGGDVYRGGRRTDRDRLPTPAAMRGLLLDPDVDAVVLELRAHDVVSFGLGCDALNIVVIDNSDQPAPVAATEHDELLDAICVVARTAREAVIVEDADPYAKTIQQACPTARLCRITTTDERHRQSDAATPAPRIPSEQLLAQMNDRDVDGILKGAQFAAVAAQHLGKDPDDVYRCLRSFTGSIGSVLNGGGLAAGPWMGKTDRLNPPADSTP